MPPLLRHGSRKKLLDNMAMLKLNKFHWHLSDDQGFRIESKLFPKLNEIGSRREYAGLEGLGLKHRGGEYFYYYKQDEIKNIVAYAAKLNIEVIPEIDLPGHASALLAAYPEFACKPREFKPTCENGIFDAAICPGNEDAYDFIDKLFSEICPLFTSTHFHIGGDEASKGHKIWDDCPKCRAAKEKNGLKNSKELQGYYMTRIGEILKNTAKHPLPGTIASMTAFLPILRVSIGCRQIRARSKGSHISVILFFLPRRTFTLTANILLYRLKSV